MTCIVGLIDGKTVIIGAIITLFLYGCQSKAHKTPYFEFISEVTYTDSSIDTLTFGRNGFKGNKVIVYIKTSDSGFISSAGTSPCLVMQCGFYTTTIACGVRKFSILERTEK